MRPRQSAGAALLLSCLVLVGVVATACSPAATSAAPPAASATVGQTAPPPAPTAASATSLPADRLAAAFAAMDGGYTYTATVKVGKSTVSTAKGRSVGGSSEFVLSTGGSSVTYRAIPPRAWVEQPGKTWVAVSGNVPAGSPIAGFTNPTGVSFVSDGAKGLAVDATYPPAALGLDGGKPVTVHLVLSPDGTVTMTYETTVGADPAATTSVFTPASGLPPIAAPSS